MGAYSGLWKLNAGSTAVTDPMAGIPDVRHHDPNAAIVDGPNGWEFHGDPLPSMPVEVTDEDSLTVDLGPGGPVQNAPGQGPGGYTAPNEHRYVNPRHSIDDKSYLAGRQAPVTTRQGQYETSWLDKPQTFANNTEEQVQVRDDWLNMPHRIGKRAKNSIKGFGLVPQPHNWRDTPMPNYAQYAKTVKQAPPMSGGTQNSSPFPTQYDQGTPNFVPPQVRMSPPNWQDGITVSGDGLAAGLGFQSWGF